MNLLEVLAGGIADEEQLAISLNRMASMIDSFYELTSDRGQLSEDQLKGKAVHWLALLGPRIFDRYLKYTIRVICLSRSWRGAITADEFLRVSMRVKNGEVWDTESREWISFDVAGSRLMNQFRPDLAEEYHRAEFEGNTDKKNRVIEECRAIIYGWDE